MEANVARQSATWLQPTLGYAYRVEAHVRPPTRLQAKDRWLEMLP